MTVIRRVIRGTEFRHKPFKPRDFPISPAIQNLLSKPTWSVRTLLPPSRSEKTVPKRPLHEKWKPMPLSDVVDTAPDTNDTQEEVTVSKLHHLLKLSALPLPQTPREEARMLSTLRSQIHFVRTIQSVDTRNVKPLVTIRDETPEAVEEQTITLEKMMPYLDLEEKVGKNGTVRRRDVVRTPEADRAERRTWEVDVGDLGTGSELRRRGKMFFVRRRKDRDTAADNSNGKKGKEKEEAEKQITTAEGFK